MGYNMDKKIVRFFKNYDINDLEIEDIKNIAPMIEYTSYKEFMENCNLLIKYGYPKEDLDILILGNPNIFVRSKKDLEDDLIKLSKEYEEIETVLKKNPNII